MKLKSQSNKTDEMVKVSKLGEFFHDEIKDYLLGGKTFIKNPSKNGKCCLFYCTEASIYQSFVDIYLQINNSYLKLRIVLIYSD